MHPGIFKKNISTQQSTRMTLEDGGSTILELEDGGDAAALAGIGHWFIVAVVALGSSGGRRTCNDGIGISIIEVERFLLGHWRQHRQGRQDRMCTMQGMYVDSNGKEIGVLWRWW